MALLISDSNIFIDLEDGGLLDKLFELPETIGVTDLLFEAELREQHANLLASGLICIELSAATLERVVQLGAMFPRPGRLDLAALATAEQESCPLLTGDKHLRVAAQQVGVKVHGTLWVAERLIDAGIITVAELRTAYRMMKSSDRRLPWQQVEDQLSRLASSKQ